MDAPPPLLVKTARALPRRGETRYKSSIALDPDLEVPDVVDFSRLDLPQKA
jgi:hypothetical protein